MSTGLVVDVDCERKDWVILRLLRLGNSDVRYVITTQEISLGRKLLVTGVRQLEGDRLVGGSSCLVTDKE